MQVGTELPFRRKSPVTTVGRVAFSHRIVPDFPSSELDAGFLLEQALPGLDDRQRGRTRFCNAVDTVAAIVFRYTFVACFNSAGIVITAAIEVDGTATPGTTVLIRTDFVNTRVFCHWVVVVAVLIIFAAIVFAQILVRLVGIGDTFVEGGWVAVIAVLVARAHHTDVRIEIA